MKLSYWMYVGPAHVGTLRVVSSFKNIFSIMHAPLGDDYYNVLLSMLERKRDYTPVATSVVDRHVLARGSQEKVVQNLNRRALDFKPDLVVLTPTCTSSILQEDLQSFVNQTCRNFNINVLLADVNHYRFTELEAADKTLFQIVSFFLGNNFRTKSFSKIAKTTKPSVNIIGALNLSFHLHHDIAELKRLLHDLNIEVNLVIPEGSSVLDLEKLPQAWLNILPYQEIGHKTAQFLLDDYSMPFVEIPPIGITQLAQFVRTLESKLKVFGFCPFDSNDYILQQTRFISQATWFSYSIDCQNLRGKTAVVFGDATHSASLVRILALEMGVTVLLAGTFCKNLSVWFRSQVQGCCNSRLITDDYALVSTQIELLRPDAIFGTQMERHIGKKLNIPCSVISTPIHIQNFPLSYRPFLGYEGTNQIMDLIYNTFTLGMEEHLLDLFRGHDTKPTRDSKIFPALEWTSEALDLLALIPGFVRQKVKQKVENFAFSNNLLVVDTSVLNDAKSSLPQLP